MRGMNAEQRMANTSVLINRQRMGKETNIDREFVEGNIKDVYAKNSVHIEDDKHFEVDDNGHLKTMKNFQRAMNRLTLGEGKAADQERWSSQVKELNEREDPFHAEPGFAGFHAKKIVNEANEDHMTEKEYN